MNYQTGDACDECSCVDCSMERDFEEKFLEVVGDDTRICVSHFEEDCLRCADTERYDC